MSPYQLEFPLTPMEAAEARERHAANGHESLVIGGGTLAMPALSQGGARPTHVIDLGLMGCREIALTTSKITVGAMVSYQQLILSPVIRRELPILHAMASGITGGIQIRNQGTLGGAACAARPQSDAPAVLVALGAQITLLSSSGTRAVSAEKFFQGAGSTALAPDEILLDMKFSLKNVSGRPYGYYKLKFAESSWPVVTAACLLSPEPSDVAPSIDLVIGGVSDVPLFVHLSNVSFDEPARDLISRAVADRIQTLPLHRRWSDIRAGTEYRTQVAGHIAYRAFLQSQESKGK
jgi:carbon-monoxide dehydrogenase medium subunit